jgi:Ca2+-binding RTX toxin-like protein
MWTPDGRSIVYAGVSTVFSIYRLDVRTGASTRLLRFGETSVLGSTGGYLALSPDGTRVAIQSGGECRDRVGIYVVGVDGRGARRLTNSCRIAGTAGADRLVGTQLADVLDGLGGNDRLDAVDPGYMGDTLRGGSGDDLLVGGYRQDVLDGGPGADRLLGGPSGDLLVGGPGRDTLSAQGGLDVVDAYDGARDAISCGTSGPTTKPERDTVYADRFDRVSRDCEVVFRHQRLS